MLWFSAVPDMGCFLREREKMKYRKKPVVIEARELTVGKIDKIAGWCGGIVRRFPTGEHSPYGIDIPTLEGDMFADIGDFIIKGIKGEFYPCKPDIFDETYDVAGESSNYQRIIETLTKALSDCKDNSLEPDKIICIVDRARVLTPQGARHE
jgi:hypothetical protein